MTASTAARGNDPSEHDRHLGLAGCPNLRDAGGYRTADGGRMRWRRVFRSGHLAHLEGEELEQVELLDLDLVVDLRRVDEQEREPSRLPARVAVLSSPITPGSQASAIYANSRAIDGGEAMFQFMCDINRQFVLSQSGHFRDIFAAILDRGANALGVAMTNGVEIGVGGWIGR